MLILPDIRLQVHIYIYTHIYVCISLSCGVDVLQATRFCRLSRVYSDRGLEIPDARVFRRCAGRLVASWSITGRSIFHGDDAVATRNQ